MSDHLTEAIRKIDEEIEVIKATQRREGFRCLTDEEYELVESLRQAKATLKAARDSDKD